MIQARWHAVAGRMAYLVRVRVSRGFLGWASLCQGVGLALLSFWISKTNVVKSRESISNIQLYSSYNPPLSGPHLGRMLLCILRLYFVLILLNDSSISCAGRLWWTLFGGLKVVAQFWSSDGGAQAMGAKSDSSNESSGWVLNFGRWSLSQGVRPAWYRYTHTFTHQWWYFIR